MSEYLKTNDVTIKQQSYTGILDGIQAESFVYLDPPYQPISKTANFTNYSTFKWNEKEQENLKNLCVELDNMGIKFMQSNSNAELIKDLYSQFIIEDIIAPRKIASGTTTQTEVLITNYKNFKLF
jgi:DNA adenine methylase